MQLALAPPMLVLVRQTALPQYCPVALPPVNATLPALPPLPPLVPPPAPPVPSESSTRLVHEQSDKVPSRPRRSARYIES